jgi:hypothetical protein
VPWFKFPRPTKGLPRGEVYQPVHAMVRLAHPTEPGKYYRHGAKAHESEWVTSGYTVWSADDWRKTFGRQADEGRHWEHFGYLIPLYDDGNPHD